LKPTAITKDFEASSKDEAFLFRRNRYNELLKYKQRIGSGIHWQHLNTNQQEAKQIRNSNDMKNRVATGRYPGDIGVLTSISANAFRMPFA